MEKLPVQTRDMVLALVVGMTLNRYRGPLTALVVLGNLGLGVAALYWLSKKGSALHGQRKLLKLRGELGVGSSSGANGVVGVHDRGMVTSTEFAANRGE